MYENWNDHEHFSLYEEALIARRSLGDAESDNKKALVMLCESLSSAVNVSFKKNGTRF